MKVKVIANKPDTRPRTGAQLPIEHLIGKIYEVKYYDKEDQSVTVYEESFGGDIVLNKNEYEIMKAH
ncbi:hypothetical protein GFC29_1381 [Anoxybacillus sp. B7M1]|jgi:hypothetical protein|uniref:DUF4926 domain-containing protein n=1 Tax=Anoxybacteroides rupiense TaxID=311460 RepID=A0ABD5J038_9BACL|nr:MULTISPECIES: hypothetical protein [Anoxybacillus]ANB57161.1 hypothetical protein GFC28_243 [Anoxybacillus sp. B2M1]ANB65680.1 hypothetical protein GFC29_1381 [Anoxybacillus sp. B7M1]MBS2772779.1 hypothetical protein [Anoxybacillus rupiensis]MDE8565739.1 hypothetical protein [Anoxybacillus rupiensis]MED5052966.1 hypothetical protein [Anoxybacillus rupiensis]